VILVAGIVDRGCYSLAECVVERVVDLGDGNTEPGGGGPIYRDVGLQPFVLLIAVDLR
jgi:hypothetical protein